MTILYYIINKFVTSYFVTFGNTSP